MPQDTQPMLIFQKKIIQEKLLVITLDAFGDHVNYSARLFENSTKGF